MLKIKVCGLRNAENIAAVASLLPNVMGFIFYPPSARFVGNDFVAPLACNIQKAGVFVNVSLKELKESGQRNRLNILQLHGDETQEYCKELRDLGYQVWKVFAVGDAMNYKKMERYLPYTDAFLFDSQSPARGGSGKPFNWQLLHDYPFEHPFYLSGGVGPKDATAILELHIPHLEGIDLNSRFEISPGIKNIQTLKTFIDELRSTSLSSQ